MKRELLPKFQVRCSELHRIMVQPKTKTDPHSLSETAKTYCQEWVTSALFGIHKQVSSPYLDKGNACELESLRMVEVVTGLKLKKNEQRFSKDGITGIPDILTPADVIELKSSWNAYTFPLFETEPTREHYAQVQGYMYLTDRPRARVAYVLNDTPFDIVQGELRRAAYRLGVEELTPEQQTAVIAQHQFSHIPGTFRVKIFPVEYNPTFMATVFEQLIKCNHYVNYLISKL